MRIHSKAKLTSGRPCAVWFYVIWWLDCTWSQSLRRIRRAQGDSETGTAEIHNQKLHDLRRRWKMEDRPVLVWMGNVPHTLICLNTWFLTGSSVWGSCGILLGEALLEELGHCGWGLRCSSPTTYYSLCLLSTYALLAASLLHHAFPSCFFLFPAW